MIDDGVHDWLRNEMTAGTCLRQRNPRRLAFSVKRP